MIVRSRFISLLFLSVILYSCKEETRVNTVDGYLFDDCNTPLGGFEVAYKANSGTAFTEPTILATDVANSNGYFRFTYELEEDKMGDGDLIVVEEVGYTTALQGVPLNKDQTLTVRRTVETPVIFTYIGNRVFQPTDTLFYGIQYGEETFKVQPSVGFMDTLYSKLPNTIDARRWVAFSFGVGQSDYDRSVESLSIEDSSYNHVWVEVEGCDDLEQFDLGVN